jgi:hypothetical protein
LGVFEADIGERIRPGPGLDDADEITLSILTLSGSLKRCAALKRNGRPATKVSNWSPG